jgi:hypothetical protein
MSKTAKCTTPIEHYEEVQPWVHTKPWYKKCRLSRTVIKKSQSYHNPLLHTSRKANANCICERGNTDMYNTYVQCDSSKHRIEVVP